MAKVVETFKLTVTLRDGETDHSRTTIISLLDKLIEFGEAEASHGFMTLDDSFEEEAFGDLASINIE